FIAEPRSKLCEIQQAAFVRHVMGAINERKFLFPFSFFSNEFSYSFICQQHKIFNKLVSVLPFSDVNTNSLAVFIQMEFSLNTFNSNRAMSKPSSPHCIS